MIFYRPANSALLLLIASLIVGLVAGCASTTPAPVYDRSLPQGGEQTPSVELKPGEYMVKKGDTLRSIALDNGQDYTDLAAWNNLENPNIIHVGQVLRVAPPGAPPAVEAGDGVEINAIAPPSQIESIPLDGKPATSTTSAPMAVAPVATGALKREPKGGTQPYSEEAWAQLQKPQAPAAPEPAPVAAPPSESTTPPTPADNTAQPVVSKTTSDIAWAWPTENKVIGTFSDAGNKGFDFDGKAGDPVHAAASGKVTLVTNSLRGYGNLIVVKHNSSYLSVYAHNSKMLVKEGQSVSTGQKIAEIGSTDSDRPKLHFEIRRAGKPVDPGKYLPQR